MSSPQVFKSIGGLAGIITGVFLFTAHLLNFVSSSSNGTVVGKTMVLIAHILAVFALIGIYEALSSKNGLLGTLGMILSVVGTIIVSAIVFVEIAAASGVDVTEVFQATIPSLIMTFGPLLFVIGLILVGISILRVNTLCKWGAGFLIAGDVIFALGSVAGGIGPILTITGAAVTGAGFILIGIKLFNQEEPIRVTRLDGLRLP